MIADDEVCVAGKSYHHGDSVVFSWERQPGERGVATAGLLVGIYLDEGHGDEEKKEYCVGIIPYHDDEAQEGELVLLWNERIIVQQSAILFGICVR